MHNPEVDQDRAFDVYDHFNRFGDIMFKQNRRVYENVAAIGMSTTSVLEAGCGSGLGSAILERGTSQFTATDKLQRNIDFASQLYPWIYFEVWDISYPTDLRAETVICVEAIEHIADPEVAIKNLVDAAIRDVWISTPNGLGKDHPPSNPNHVCEYTTHDMILMILDAANVEIEIYHWETLEMLTVSTTVDPLVYRIRKL